VTEIFKILHFCKHLLTAKILHVTGSCPKNVIVSELSRVVVSSEELTGTTEYMTQIREVSFKLMSL